MRVLEDPTAQVASALLERDHKAILQVEQLAANSGRVVQILEDLKQVVTPPVRLMMMSFEENNYQSSSPSGRHALSGLVCTLPDNKLVEDLHGVIRNDSKSQKTRRQTVHHMMELLTNSKMLASRSIPQKAKIDRETFLAAFPRTPDQKRKRLVGQFFKSCCHSWW